MLKIHYDHRAHLHFALPIVLACLWTVPATAMADPVSDTHIFRLGVYDQDIDIKAASTRQGFEEVELDFDESLGLDESADTIFLQYQWRFLEKWKLSAFYTNLEADGEKTASQDFNWNGQDYEAGVRVGTEFGLDTYLVAVDYSFIRDERKEFGVGFGLHAFDIQTTLELEGRIEGDDGDSAKGRVVRNNSDLLAPLPNVRLFADYLLTPKWAILGSAGWLSVDYEDWSGDYLFLTLLTEYRFTERFGAGISFQISQIEVEHDNGSRKRTYDIGQYGPSIYLTYGF